MNLPNQLTVGRFFITVVFVALLSTDWRFANTAGLLLFAIASVTDYLDGEIARRRNLVTDFGKLMDPLADKIMMAAAFILLVPQEAFPAWVAIAIISREFLITGLRLLAASKGVVLPAEKLGKHKTIWQIVMVLYFFLLLSLKEMQSADWFFIGTPWVYAWKVGGPILIGVVLILTILSGCGYVRKNWKLVTSGSM
jgi:CDP-diacylglycerol--glycerol-3-phosphate 3-phosphatidyltransferase